MPKKPLSKEEYVEAMGGSEADADTLYAGLRDWRRAKTKEDAKRALWTISGIFRGVGNLAPGADKPVKPYPKDWLTPEQVRQQQAQLLQVINATLEGRRKDFEAYKRQLIQATVSVHGHRSQASTAKMKIAGELLAKRTAALMPVHRVIGGGSTGGGLSEEEKKLTDAKRLKHITDGRQQDIRGINRAADGTPIMDEGVAARIFSQMGAYQGDQAGEDVDMIVSHTLENNWTVQDYETAMLSHVLNDRSGTDIMNNFLTEDKKDYDWAKIEAAVPPDRRERYESFRKYLYNKAAKIAGTLGGRGGGHLQTIPGVTDEEYLRLEQIAQREMNKLGAGGGELGGILTEIMQAGDISTLQGLENQLRQNIQVTSQGEAAPGRTPSGDGAIPPGTSATAPMQTGVSPGGDLAKKIEELESPGPDFGLNRMVKMYEDMDNARTSAKDIHLLGQIQKSPEWGTMKRALGIEDDRAALKAAMMLTRRRRRDARMRDANKLRDIRREMQQNRLVSGLRSGQMRGLEKPAQEGRPGASLTAGSDTFSGVEEKDETEGLA